MAEVLIYQALDHELDELRLVTILPLAPDAPESAQVECFLQKYWFGDDQYTTAYRNYLQSEDTFGAWIDPRTPSDRLSERSNPDGWVKIMSPDDDLTTNLPEFRYQWGDFMALSYTWGGPDDRREILVNGHLLSVTQNVEAGLKELRSKHYVRSGWKLWIDALCINQRDLTERASQVKKMGEIYSRAWTPIVWLGEQGEGTDDALNLVASLASDYSSSDGVNQLTNALHKNPEFFGKGSWRALYELIIRPYWRRLWILQEVSRGRSTTPVLCGYRTLSLYQFTCAFGVLIQSDEVINTYITNELRAASIPFDIELWAYLGTISEIQDLQDSQQAGDRTNLYRILNLSRTVFSVDPRDKIYGLLGTNIGLSHRARLHSLGAESLSLIYPCNNRSDRVT